MPEDLSGGLSPESRFGFSDDLFKSGFVLDGKIRENLPVERDSGRLQTFNEAAVGDAFCADRSVESRNPK